MKELTGYELSRDFFDFCFENPDKVRPVHIAIYMFAIEHCNRLGWKPKFGFPTQMTMDAIGIKNWRTYISAFNNLVEWGFFDLIEKSKNQYSANVIAIVKNTKAHTKALAKATQSHLQKQSNSIVGIDKLDNLEPITNKLNKPTLEDVKSYCLERKNSVDPQRWFDYYTANGFKVGKNQMKDWRAAVRTWENNNKLQPLGHLVQAAKKDSDY
jgi:hypothetical protein